MSLSARERMVLTRTENELDRSYPELAAEFATFDRCVSIPRQRRPAEPVLRQRRPRVVGWLAAGLIAAVALVLALLPTGGSDGPCPPGSTTTAAAGQDAAAPAAGGDGTPQVATAGLVTCEPR